MFFFSTFILVMYYNAYDFSTKCVKLCLGFSLAIDEWWWWADDRYFDKLFFFFFFDWTKHIVSITYLGGVWDCKFLSMFWNKWVMKKAQRLCLKISASL